jgi:hypothetical protein
MREQGKRTIPGTEGFRDFCRREVAMVFSSLGHDAPTFRKASDGDHLVGEFRYRDRDHRIEIYNDDVVMLDGVHLFEAYMPREWETAESVVAGFCERLRRYLAGGPWDVLEDESPFIARVRAAARALFRSIRR